ncbi:hypothetical protein FLK61_34090 [Paenalkalicoccus suaedae]|uniref:Bacteriophage Gp15 protein n=1 Tax=Paenalkalicoccus suaedae TaxID=2592382 RepID=A0A859FGB6_9BACI|nr:Gp15 family bacteriophage protein [Paenalkalicoccus suaedae]QKS71658.1 hypothetical protein FLK61_33795 [Paenalkalicoccus suaedae]QKS71712.1 hypothetical protein FLK61_34090 [Paenalkalicoccus suaedae]
MKPFSLTQRFDDELELDGVTYKLDLAFDNVLRIFELFGDEEFHPIERIALACELFIGENQLDLETKDKVVYHVFLDFLDIDIREKSDPNVNTEKFYDLYEDAERIYASFIKEYDIDLFEQHGKLHFIKFRALLSMAIDRDFKEVVGIRAQKVPAPTKYNKEDREHTLKLKRIYKLKGIEDPDLIEQRVENGWNKLANFFRPSK